MAQRSSGRFSEEAIRAAVFTRRALLLGGVQILALGAVAARLNQLGQNEDLRSQGLENRTEEALIRPERGKVYDRNRNALAINTSNFRALLAHTEVSRASADRSVRNAAALLQLAPQERRALLALAQNPPSREPLILAENLEWDQVSVLETRQADLPGVYVDRTFGRQYLYGQIGAHVVGYVQRAREKDIERDSDPLLKLPGFLVGQTGIEASQDIPLRGQAGLRAYEVNAFGKVLRQLEQSQPRPGIDQHLTIDIELQQRVYDRLAEGLEDPRFVQAAAAVVMDVTNGEILAAVSYPSYDPMLFTNGMTAEQWDRLSNNEHAPIRFKATRGEYPPGSTFKMATLLAAQAQGFKRDDVFECTGSVEIANRTFRCWNRRGHGEVNMVRALRESCDCYFYELIQQVGWDSVAAMAQRLGFNAAVMPDFSDENRGSCPTREEHFLRRGQEWRIGDSVNACIGQGFILATPVQLATFTARIANGGYAVVPHIVRTPMPYPAPALDIPQAHLAVIQEGMWEVVNHERGTAKKAAIQVEGQRMAGKTGTSQVRALSQNVDEFENDWQLEVPWRHRDHALFVGYAPVEQPRFSCAVVVEHGTSGSKAAAPLARDILINTQALAQARGYSR